VEDVKYPADWLANGGPPFEQIGLRTLNGPLTDYAAITVVWDGVWKVVVGEGNTVVAEGDLNDLLTYLFEYGWRVEDAARQANS
jgi:hypothetical protein